MDNYTWELIKNQLAMDITQFAYRLEENAEKKLYRKTVDYMYEPREQVG